MCYPTGNRPPSAGIQYSHTVSAPPPAPPRMKAFWAWAWARGVSGDRMGGEALWVAEGRREAGRLPQLIFSAHESPEEAPASSPLKLANCRMLMVILPIMTIIASIT